ncbi:MAG TPA: hypothetical protein VKJ47_13815 [Candidatus Binatia bacterium]|nr:hypothetical protein [Candidatus Binatia bacterium]
MMRRVKNSLVVICSLAGMLALPLLVSTAAADMNYGREGSRAGTRLTERDMRSLDNFLDAHWEIADELYRDPELVNNDRFLRGHGELRDWMDNHPDAAQAIQADPRAAIWHERTTARSEGERRSAPAQLSERDSRSLDDYLNSHDETAQELSRNPDLINDRQYVRGHQALHDWMDSHQEAAATIQANPDKFLRRERSVGAKDVLRQLLK